MSGRNPARGGEEDGAPIEDGALGHEGDEAETADHQHDAMGQDEERRGTLLLAAIGEEMPAEDHEQTEDHRDDGERGQDRGSAGPKQGAHAAGPGDAADAEEAVET